MTCFFGRAVQVLHCLVQPNAKASAMSLDVGHTPQQQQVVDVPVVTEVQVTQVQHQERIAQRSEERGLCASGGLRRVNRTLIKGDSRQNEANLCYSYTYPPSVVQRQVVRRFGKELSY